MKSHLKIFVVTLSLIFVTGCGTTLFSHRETNPSIQDLALNTHIWPWSKQGLNTFSTTASRRMILMRIEDWGHRIISCAEPSPDVGESFKTSIYDALKFAIKHEQSQIAADLANTYKREAETQISTLLNRSQGLQLYRDAVHNLCIDRMNDGWVLDDASNFDTSFLEPTEKKQFFKNQIDRFTQNKEKYYLDKDYIFKKSVELIKLEMRNVPLLAATTAVARALEAVEKANSDKTDADKLVNTEQIKVNVADKILADATAALAKASETEKSAAKKTVEDATLNLNKAKEVLKSAKENADKAATVVKNAEDYAEKMQKVVDKFLLAEVVPTKEEK